MERLRFIPYKHIPAIRINDSFAEPAMATDLFEHDLDKLNILTQEDTQSFAREEQALRTFLVD